MVSALIVARETSVKIASKRDIADGVGNIIMGDALTESLMVLIMDNVNSSCFQTTQKLTVTVLYGHTRNVLMKMNVSPKKIVIATLRVPTMTLVINVNVVLVSKGMVIIVTSRAILRVYMASVIHY